MLGRELDGVVVRGKGEATLAVAAKFDIDSEPPG
jgi:hypothetical protein